jgi:hypothetical protein
VFDIEHVIGSFYSMDFSFKNAFAKANEAGLAVVITTSHSGPYQTDSPQDAVDFVKSWVKDPNVDVISPQLYSSGYETEPDFDETSTAGLSWTLYIDSVARIVPSIIDERHYPEVQAYF